MATFVEVGRALAEIRDGRLYRDSHATFAAYLKERWGMDRQRAYQLIGESAAATDVKHVLQKPNARQAGALAKAPPEKRAEVWEGVLEDAEQTGEKVTAAKVAEAVERVTPAKPTRACQRGSPAETPTWRRA